MHAAHRRSAIAGLRLRRSTSQPVSMTAVQKPRTATSGCGFIVLSIDLVEQARARIECAADSASRNLRSHRDAVRTSLCLRNAPANSTRRATSPKAAASYRRGGCQVKFVGEAASRFGAARSVRRRNPVALRRQPFLAGLAAETAELQRLILRRALGQLIKEMADQVQPA